MGRDDHGRGEVDQPISGKYDVGSACGGAGGLVVNIIIWHVVHVPVDWGPHSTVRAGSPLTWLSDKVYCLYGRLLYQRATLARAAVECAE